MDTKELDNKELNTLHKYGVEFQTKCLAAVVSDRLFLERILDILSPDFFETNAQKWVLEKIIEYFQKFRDVPSATVFTLELQKIDPQMKLLRQSVADLLGTIYEHASDTDLKYVEQEFLTFCQTRALAKAILVSLDHLKKGDFEAIKTTVDGALRAGMERNLGHNYKADIDKRMSLLARDCIKTKWPEMNQPMDGGLGKGELGFVIAPTGAGKTWILCGLGAEAMKQGKTVLHITLELNENYVGLRYDAYFTGIHFQKIRENQDLVKKYMDQIPGQVFIKYFPLKTVSPISIKLFVERFQMLQQVKIDLLIVDYADILRPFVIEKGANTYNEAGSVYEELRAIAGELQIPIWSASQGNRSSERAEVVQGDNVADSYRKVMTGDFIFSLSRTIDDVEDSMGRIYIVKNRFGPDKLVYPCRFDASCGHITLYDKSSSEGLELLDKMKKEANTSSKAVVTMWNKFQNGKKNAD